MPAPALPAAPAARPRLRDAPQSHQLVCAAAAPASAEPEAPIASRSTSTGVSVAPCVRRLGAAENRVQWCWVRGAPFRTLSEGVSCGPHSATARFLVLTWNGAVTVTLRDTAHALFRCHCGTPAQACGEFGSTTAASHSPACNRRQRDARSAQLARVALESLSGCRRARHSRCRDKKQHIEQCMLQYASHATPPLQHLRQIEFAFVARPLGSTSSPHDAPALDHTVYVG